MKINKLKCCFVIILSFAMCSLKAQSLLQKQQQDIEQRKKYANETLLKAREQQAQQQAERTQYNTGSGTSLQQNTQTTPAEQKKNDAKTQPVSPTRKPKQLATQQTSPARRGNTEQ